MSRFLTSKRLRVTLSLAFVLAPHSAYAIVSERHLKGVSALQCDLEIGRDQPSVVFTLLVDAKEKRLRLADGGQRFPYEELSESALRFPLTLAAQSPMTCILEMPAGALSCANSQQAGNPRLGLCFPQN